MHRVDTSTASAALPAVDAAGTPGFFTKGNPANSTPATVPGQDWFNMIQEELNNVVQVAGLVPDQTKSDFTQLLQAMSILYKDINAIDVPVSTVLASASASIPTGFLECNGASLLRASYSALFALVGTIYGASDASHFNLPDLRGEFIRGSDNGRGVDIGRIFGSAQSDSLQNITGDFGVDHSSLQFANGAFSITGYANTSITGNTGYVGRSADFDASRVARTANETRPRNIAMIYIIKY